MLGGEARQDLAHTKRHVLYSEYKGVVVDEEVIVKLADGWTLRSGLTSKGWYESVRCGEYVRLCRPNGTEYMYWDKAEWHDDPVLVMGAIINSASGYRPHDGSGHG